MWKHSLLTVHAPINTKGQTSSLLWYRFHVSENGSLPRSWASQVGRQLARQATVHASWPCAHLPILNVTRASRHAVYLRRHPQLLVHALVPAARVREMGSFFAPFLAIIFFL